MSHFHTDASGRRVVIDDAPTPAADAEPPTLIDPHGGEPSWVDLFLGPNEHGLPLYSPPRNHRKPARKSFRLRTGKA